MSELWGFQPLSSPSGPTSSSSNLVNSATLAATSSAQTVALPGANVNSQCQIQIANQTTVWAYVNFGQSTVTAVTVATGYPVAPGAVVVVTVAPDVNTASVILAGSGAGSVTFTRGVGL